MCRLPLLGNFENRSGPYPIAEVMKMYIVHTPWFVFMRNLLSDPSFGVGMPTGVVSALSVFIQLRVRATSR